MRPRKKEPNKTSEPTPGCAPSWLTSKVRQKMKALRHVALLSLVSILAGCVSSRWVLPKVVGRISDVSSGAPIVGAKVHWRSAPNDSTTSGEDGRFTLSPIKKWEFGFGDPGLPADEIRIEASGYEKISVRVIGSMEMRESRSLDFTLKKNRTNRQPTSGLRPDAAHL